MDKQLVQEMNKFLKGIHMGGASFRDYLNKAQDMKLKDELTNIMESFKTHEEAITSLIDNMGGAPTDSLGVIGTMAEFWEKLKLIYVDSDLKVCEHAVLAMEMGIKQGNKFINEHEGLPKDVKEEMMGVVRDYDNHLINIKKLMNNYK